MSVKARLLLLALGFWGLHAAGSLQAACFLFSAYGFYLYFRFRKPLVLFFWCLLFLPVAVHLRQEPDIPRPGEYTVISVHTGYAIGKSDSAQVVLYGLDSPQLEEVYQISSFSPVSSLKNLNLFSFQDTMAARGITYGANISGKDLIRTSDSLKARLFRFVCRDETAAMVFYGIGKTDSLFSQMSLGVLGALHTLKRLAQRFIKEDAALCLQIFLAVLYGYFFVFPASLLRLCLFSICRLLIPERTCSFSVALLLFLLISPENAFSIALILPCGFRLLNMFWPVKTRKICSILFLCWVQLFCFSSLDLLSLAGYSILKGIWGIYFWLTLVSLFLPFSVPLLPALRAGLTWTWSPPLLFLLPLAILAALLAGSRTRWSRVWAVCGFALLFAGPWIDPFFHLYIVNIGQGDCALIQEPFRHSAVMIDCGQNLYRDNVQSIILPFLQNRHIRKLDALILTHDDFDHSGGSEALQEALEIGQVIQEEPDEDFVDYPFEFLLPERQAEDENDSSLITWFSYDSLSYLFMGDASVNVENQLMQEMAPLDVQVLKVGHHGSDTSTGAGFLDWCSPEIALISVGENNRYGHPASSVLASLEKAGVNTLMTKDSGMIHIFTFHSLCFVQTADGQLACFRVNPESGQLEAVLR